MLGPRKTRDLDRPVLISVETYVPAGHLFRHLHCVLDLSFVRDLVADRYAAGGRPSIDPEVFFRLHLIMFFAGIRSERQLLEQAGYNLAMRWYAGYNLDEPLPDHSSLSKIRARLGLPVFRRFFEAITEQCVEAGLVRGDELIFDATRVRANAAMDSLVPRLRQVVDGHLLDVFGPDQADAALAEAPGADEQRPPRLLRPPVAPWPRSHRTRLREPDRPPRVGICWTRAASIPPARRPTATSARATGR